MNVTDNATGNSIITLNTTGNLPDGVTPVPTVLAASVVVGTLIAELQTFDMTIASVSTKNNKAIAASISVTSIATSATNTALKANGVHVTNVVNVTFEKFVRNVTLANGTAPATVINTFNFYPSTGAVTAKTGNVLEYAIRATAPATAPLAGATVTDAVPTFTTYVPNSTLLNGITVAGDSATSPLAAGLAIDDNAARAAAAAATGNIAAGGVAVVTFQVTVQ